MMTPRHDSSPSKLKETPVVWLFFYLDTVDIVCIPFSFQQINLKKNSKKYYSWGVALTGYIIGWDLSKWYTSVDHNLAQPEHEKPNFASILYNTVDFH